jgi:hypothetical protein
MTAPASIEWPRGSSVLGDRNDYALRLRRTLSFESAAIGIAVASDGAIAPVNHETGSRMQDGKV